MFKNSIIVYPVGHEMIPYLNFAWILQYHIKTQICNVHKNLSMEIILNRGYVQYNCCSGIQLPTDEPIYVLVTTLWRVILKLLP
jgi:hypothetical protein